MINIDHTAIQRRLPRARIDPIDSPERALAVIAMAVARPLRPETIVILLDDARRGDAIVVVSGTVEPDSVIEVVECIAGAASTENLDALVVASVRPGGDTVEADIDRWLEMSDVASIAGVEVIEWFVLGNSISCPRDLLGELPRW